MTFPDTYALEISEANWPIAFALLPHRLAGAAPEDFFGSFVVINVVSGDIFGGEPTVTISNILETLERFSERWTYPNPQELKDDEFNLVRRMPKLDPLEELRQKLNKPAKRMPYTN